MDQKGGGGVSKAMEIQSLPNLENTMEGLLQRLSSGSTSEEQVSLDDSSSSSRNMSDQNISKNGSSSSSSCCTAVPDPFDVNIIQNELAPTEKNTLVNENVSKVYNGDTGSEQDMVSASKGNNSFKRGCTWFWSDMKKKHLVWVKIALFLQSAGMVSLYPYLAIHMRSLGFSVEDTALVNLAIPVADIFGPPIAGFISDKIGNFKIFCALITVLNGASSLLLMAIPSLTEEVTMEVCCGQDNNNCYYNQTEVIEYPVTTWINGTTVNLVPLKGTETGLLCSNMACAIASNWTRAFWSYLAVRVILDLFRSSCLSIFESAVMAIVQKEGGDYGLQKLFGTAGSVIFGPLAGLIIDVGSKEGENYNVVFYLYFVLRFLSALAILQLSLKFKKKASNVFKNVGKVLCQVEVMSFLMAFFMAGILWGFLETFLFWYLEDLGSTKFLMGWTLAVGTMLGVPLSIFSKLIMEKIGHCTILYSALMFYTIRMLGYSFIQKPEYSILFEAMKPFCTTIVFVSAFTIVKDHSPMETVASVNSIFGALYFGVGRGLGGLLSGFSIEGFGAVMTFRYFAAASFICGNIYLAVIMVHRFKMKRKTAEALNNFREEVNGENVTMKT